MVKEAMDYLKLTPDPLRIDEICSLVNSAKCGAISSFIGTTRDNFEEKTVVRLEYEAYEDMALKSLKELCKEIRSKWGQVEHIAIYHRLGVVATKEASIVIAISSPHRKDALEATEWCIDNVKKSVPIWKKEIYAEDAEGAWKENKECVWSKTCNNPKIHKFTQLVEPDMHVENIPQHLIQVKASGDEVDARIASFMERKRAEIDAANIRDFCRVDPNQCNGNSCARIDSVLRKQKNSKGHIEVKTIYNRCRYNDENHAEHLIPTDGVSERISNLQTQLGLDKATPTDIYARLKQLEERLLHLESLSPEYIQFWSRMGVDVKSTKTVKKVFGIQEIDRLISQTSKNILKR